MQKKIWRDLEEMFLELNKQQIRYVVLRNYEEMELDNFYSTGHGDIDFLTDNVTEFVKVLNAYPRFVSDDRIHYLVNINHNEVVIDIRSVGDDYYCRNWEIDILNKRKKYKYWYIPDDLNYYYSLVYHSILQKSFFSDDYALRLEKMTMELGLDGNDKNVHIINLIKYMKSNKYYFTYPDDIWVPLNIEYIPQRMIRKKYKIYFRKIKSVIISYLVRVKRKIFGIRKEKM